MVFLKLIFAVLISVLTPLVKNNTGSYLQVSSTDQNSNSQPKISQYAEVDSAPVTPVNQPSDVQSTDWAFQALQSLSEHYGCLSGYPNGTFQGNRTMTRLEFAAALYSCTNTVSKSKTEFTQEDLETVQKLQEQFNPELAIILRDRVNALEARIDQLEANQFATPTKKTNAEQPKKQASPEDKEKQQLAKPTEKTSTEQSKPQESSTPKKEANTGKDPQEQCLQWLEKDKPLPTTTTLDGQIIFAATDASNSGGNRNNLTLSDRVRLNLNTSFTGKDRLLARLQASNVVKPNGPGNETRLSFQSGTDTSNNVLLSKLEYRFPIGKQTCVMLATGFNTYFDDAEVINPLYKDGDAAISRFGRYSPIYRLGGDTGIGVTFNSNNYLTAQTFYLAGNTNANDPSSGNGLFNGKYGALGQIIFYPNTRRIISEYKYKDKTGDKHQYKDTRIAFTYVNAYNNNGLGDNTGSLASNLLAPNMPGPRVSSNSYGIETNVYINDYFQLGGWVSYMNARALTGAVKGDADIWSWAVTLDFPIKRCNQDTEDCKKKVNNLAGIIIGMEPRLTGSSAQLSNLPRRDPNTGFHIEAFYRYQINEKISITPGVIWLTAPNHNDQNGDIFVGVLRTTFKF